MIALASSPAKAGAQSDQEIWIPADAGVLAAA